MCEMKGARTSAMPDDDHVRWLARAALSSSFTISSCMTLRTSRRSISSNAQLELREYGERLFSWASCLDAAVRAKGRHHWQHPAPSARRQKGAPAPIQAQMTVSRPAAARTEASTVHCLVVSTGLGGCTGGSEISD